MYLYTSAFGWLRLNSKRPRVLLHSFGIKGSGSRVAQTPQGLEISLDAVEYNK
jgi:hypothetical protein